MKRLKIATIIAIASVFFVGCPAAPTTLPDKISESGSQSEPEAVEESKADDASGERAPKTSAPAKAQNQVTLDKANKSKDTTAKPIDRKIIRNAVLQLESPNPDEVQQKITAIAEAKEGFVIQSKKSSSQIRNRGRDTVTMSIRIPASSFNEVLEEIRKTANRVVDESVTGRDVTEEFIDIEARLKTKKALEERFLEIMKQSRNVQEALNVQRELANVRGEIERIEGRKRFLENQASLSTIKVTVRTPTAISGSSSGFFYDLKEAVSDGFDAALAFILILIRVLIAIIPFLLLIVLPVFLILRYFWRAYMRKRKARKTAEEELKDEVFEE